MLKICKNLIAFNLLENDTMVFPFKDYYIKHCRNHEENHREQFWKIVYLIMTPITNEYKQETDQDMAATMT